MRYLRSGLLAAALCLTCSEASAQTASETVAFILFGLEDAKILDIETGKASVHQKTGMNSASYELTFSDGSSPVEIVVSPVDFCKFDVSVNDAVTHSPVVSRRYDFGQLQTAARDKDGISLSFGGQCPIKEGNECQSNTKVISQFNGADERIQNAIGYFKTSFCAGSAF